MHRNPALTASVVMLILACGLPLLVGCGGVASVPSRDSGLAARDMRTVPPGQSGTVPQRHVPDWDARVGTERGTRASAGRAQRGGTPMLAVIGASVADGVGAGHRQDAWPEDLARMLGWRVVVSADPGAGYIRLGEGHRGPFDRLAARLHLAGRHPAVVLIQGGHNDIGRSLSLLRRRVEALVAEIHREVPQARLGVLTVFITGNHASRAALATNRVIVAAARHADPRVMVFNPLKTDAHWHFPRVHDHLHPTAAGHRWIARRLAGDLRSQVPLTCATVAGTRRIRCRVGISRQHPRSRSRDLRYSSPRQA